MQRGVSCERSCRLSGVPCERSYRQPTEGGNNVSNSRMAVHVHSLLPWRRPQFRPRPDLMFRCRKNCIPHPECPGVRSSCSLMLAFMWGQGLMWGLTDAAASAIDAADRTVFAHLSLPVSEQVCRKECVSDREWAGTSCTLTPEPHPPDVPLEIGVKSPFFGGTARTQTRRLWGLGLGADAPATNTLVLSNIYYFCVNALQSRSLPRWQIASLFPAHNSFRQLMEPLA